MRLTLFDLWLLIVGGWVEFALFALHDGVWLVVAYLLLVTLVLVILNAIRDKIGK